MKKFFEWLKSEYGKDSALRRAVKTVAQSAVALIGTEAVGVTDIDWVGLASASALAGVLSLLLSVANAPLSSDEWEGTTGE